MSRLFLFFIQLAFVLPVIAQTTEPFINVSDTAGITATHSGYWELFDDEFTSGYLGIGQAWGDYNNDGYVDLYVTGNLEPSVLYQNNGDGTFSVSEYSEQLSLSDVKTGGAVWIDYDNDGWQDLYVLNAGANTLFHNDSGTSFTNVTDIAGVGDTGKGTTATWGDYDKDSYLDLYVVNWSCFPECGDPDVTREHDLARDTLYHNNGDGTFTDVSDLLEYDLLLGAGFAASFTDYDNDGDLDIYVVNDIFKNMLGNILWRNDGAGCDGWCWVDVSIDAGARTMIHGMGLAVGDYDNDLDLDFYFSDMVNGMALLQNLGDGTFDNVANNAGVMVGPSSAVGWGTVFFDYDNDGWLDLYLTTTEFVQFDIYSGPEGMMFEYRDFLFRNNANGTFRDVTPQSWIDNITPSMGLAYADYDQDGWVDYVLGNWNNGYALFHNTGAQTQRNHWLAIRLTGGGAINQNAVGSRAYITDNNGQVQMQEVIAGSSLGAGNELTLHFGLGRATHADIRIVWSDQTETLIENVGSDQFIDIVYGADGE